MAQLFDLAERPGFELWVELEPYALCNMEPTPTDEALGDVGALGDVA